MEPSLKEGEKVLIARTALCPPRVGDIVLARHKVGLRLHRLVWAPFVLGHWRTKADQGFEWDPPLRPQDVLGTVVPAEGRGRRRIKAIRSLVEGLFARVFRPTQTPVP